MHTARSLQLQCFAMLFCTSIVAMFCTVLSNNAAGHYLTAPWLARSSLPAALVACAVYLSIRPARSFALSAPTTPRRAVFHLAVWWLFAWLVGSAIYAEIRGSWVAHVMGAPALVNFLILGPLTEELLFRGAIFELAQRTWTGSLLPPILLSTVLFSAYHLQLHGYGITPFVLFQLAFTIPLGYVLARIRSLTGSIWPGLAVHMATNLPHAFGSSAGSA